VTGGETETGPVARRQRAGRPRSRRRARARRPRRLAGHRRPRPRRAVRLSRRARQGVRHRADPGDLGARRDSLQRSGWSRHCLFGGSLM